MMTCGPMPAPASKRERDKQKVLKLLWTIPLADVHTLANHAELEKNRCYRLLTDTAGDKQVAHATLGRGSDVRSLFWLSRRGVLDVEKLTGWKIPWQVSETSIGWQVRRLNISDAIYPLLPQVMGCLGLDMKQFNPDSNPTAFRWMREGPIDAVVKHGTGLSWLAFVWIGNMVTENKLKEKVQLAMEQLQGRYTPAAWVIVCYDRLAALHAAEIWPGEHVLVVTIDGHVERAATPGPCTSPPEEEDTAVRLGRPERVVNWLDKEHKSHKPAMLAINGRLKYQAIRLAGEFPGWVPGQLAAALGESYRAAVRPMKEAELSVMLEGGLYQSPLGMRTIARMDRISPKDVYERSGVYLDKAGTYRREQENHNRAVIEVYLALRQEEGVSAFGGFRGLRDIPGDPEPSRISPDVILCLHRPNRSTLRVYVEVEFSATSREDIRDKLRRYVLLQKELQQPVPLAFIAADEHAEQLVQELGMELREDLPMLLITNWDRFVENVRSGGPTVWKFHGTEDNIHVLTKFRDAWDDRHQRGE